ncbi:MAG: isocitrate lyase/PEP mutase family protein [Thermodesulfobacteriota bacterium]
MDTRFGRSLRQGLKERDIIPFIGVYDVFSASIAAKYYDAMFISGFGFAASYYGLPDIGFIAWSDVVAFVQRVRTVLPHHHILVDIDDGYADIEVACHVVSLLEAIGASGVIIEDQKRPRRCGHLDGKQLMELDEFLKKLSRVLATRHLLFVVARTDAADVDEIKRRTRAFAEAGADAILVDAIHDLNLIKTLKSQVDKPLVFNQIAGGKSPSCTLRELRNAGVSLVIYSTPCLFAAQAAIVNAMKSTKENDGLLQDTGKGHVDVSGCTTLLNENLARRDRK